MATIMIRSDTTMDFSTKIISSQPSEQSRSMYTINVILVNVLYFELKVDSGCRGLYELLFVIDSNFLVAEQVYQEIQIRLPCGVNFGNLK